VAKRTGRPKGSGVTPVIVLFLYQFRVDTETGCWVWIGSRNGRYGVAWDGTKVVRAHRLSYKLFVGNLPDELTIDHLCRNPPCVNPLHLEAVPKAVNTLRGMSLAAQHARQTHCVNGHPFDEENTYQWSSSYQPRMRQCKACRRERAERRKREREAATCAS